MSLNQLGGFSLYIRQDAKCLPYHLPFFKEGIAKVRVFHPLAKSSLRVSHSVIQNSSAREHYPAMATMKSVPGMILNPSAA